MPPCPEQPIVRDPYLPSVGGPFFDCGGVATEFRSPSPTALPHGFGDGLLGESSICFEPFTIQGWWSNSPHQPALPDVIFINDSDRVIENNADFPAIMITGSHVKWTNHAGSVEQVMLAPDAWMIEVDGECIRPTPEPGVSFALMVGVLLLSVFGRCRRSWRS